jgi:hypothetical protein
MRLYQQCVEMNGDYIEAQIQLAFCKSSNAKVVESRIILISLKKNKRLQAD